MFGEKKETKKKSIEYNIKSHIKQIYFEDFPSENQIIKDDEKFKLWKIDYQSSSEHARYLQTVKWTLLGILFPIILIVLGQVILSIETMKFEMVVVSCIMSLTLIWAWVLFAVRFDMGDYALTQYIEHLEMVLFDQDSKKLPALSLGRKKTHYISFNRLGPLDLRKVLAFVVGIFSGFSIWLIFYKFELDVINYPFDIAIWTKHLLLLLMLINLSIFGYMMIHYRIPKYKIKK